MNMSNLPEGEVDRLIYLNNIFVQAKIDGYEIGDFDSNGEWFEGTDIEREQKVEELNELFDWAVENLFINKWVIPGDRYGCAVWDWSSKAHRMAHEWNEVLEVSLAYE